MFVAWRDLGFARGRFALMGTVVVLVWIFGRQAGTDAVAFLLGGLVVIGLGAWIYGRATLASARTSRSASRSPQWRRSCWGS